jgi:hypothetical protein
MKRNLIVVSCLSVCAAGMVIVVPFIYGINAETASAVTVSIFGLYIVGGVLTDRVVNVGVGAFRPPYSITGKFLAAILGFAMICLSVSSLVRV